MLPGLVNKGKPLNGAGLDKKYWIGQKEKEKKAGPTAQYSSSLHTDIICFQGVV